MASLTATVPEDLLDGTDVDHLMAYFTYSQGFRGGGFNSTATGGTDLEPFDPEFIDFFDDRAQVAFYAQNLTDQEYMLFGQNLAPFFGVVSAVYGPPRTYGAEISWRFD
jgi:outer membrane receptor protein involved in Fe transport